jgi:hypothetical protein
MLASRKKTGVRDGSIFHRFSVTLSFRSEVALGGNSLKAQIIDSYQSFGEGLYAIFSRPLYRSIGRESDVRGDRAHINVNETIDARRVQAVVRRRNISSAQSCRVGTA